MKKILFFLFCISINIFAKTTFNFTNQLVVIYKVLDPLKVEVDTPQKMTVKKGSDTFLYSETSKDKRLINVRVEAPYNQRDAILDSIYGKATLELRNNGQFNLVQVKDPTKEIKGRGFFQDSRVNGVAKVTLQGGANPDNKYRANTNIDVVFNEDKQEMLMGIYKGVLYLDVTYGG